MKSIKTKEINIRYDIYFVAAFLIILVLFKQAMLTRLPAVVYSDSPHDDLWVIKAAENILAGNWLGDYNQFTLIKGAFSPMLMAFARWSGATYQGINTFLYSVACITFIMAIKPVFKTKWLLGIIFVVLLFNPLTYADETWQRVYRNGMAQWQLLFIFSGFFGMYLRRKETNLQLIMWAMIGGLSLWAFRYTREDGIWLMPFVLMATIILIIMLYVERNQNSTLRFTQRTVIFVVPLIMLFVGNASISAVNKSYYGVSLVNDRDGGSYAKVVRDLYGIKPNELDDALYSSEEYKPLYYNIYASTLQKAYDVSPTLGRLSDGINLAIAQWDSGEELVDGELNFDHVLFAIRDGIAYAGYYKDLVSTEALYSQIHEELQAAFKAGDLEKKGFSFSAMTAPWEKGYLPELISSIGDAYKEVITYNGVFSRVISATGPESYIDRFEVMSGDIVIRKKIPSVSIKGWAFAYDISEKLILDISTNDGQVLTTAVFNGGDDVYKYFLSKGYDYKNAENSRFSMELEGYSMEDQLVFTIKGVDGLVKNVYELNKVPVSNLVSEDGLCFFFDTVTQRGANNVLRDSLEYYTERCNNIVEIYKRTGSTFSFVGLISYLIVTILMLYRWRSKEITELFPIWLILTALGLSQFLFIAAIAYVNVSTFASIYFLYLASAYPMNLMFWTISICIIFEECYTYVKGFLFRGDNIEGRNRFGKS